MMTTTTTPTLSGQLRVSNPDAQTLRNSFGVTQISSRRFSYEPRFDCRETRELANFTILFNSGVLAESATSFKGARDE